MEGDTIDTGGQLNPYLYGLILIAPVSSNYHEIIQNSQHMHGDLKTWANRFDLKEMKVLSLDEERRGRRREFYVRRTIVEVVPSPTHSCSSPSPVFFTPSYSSTTLHFTVDERNC